MMPLWKSKGSLRKNMRDENLKKRISLNFFALPREILDDDHIKFVGRTAVIEYEGHSYLMKFGTKR